MPPAPAEADRADTGCEVQHLPVAGGSLAYCRVSGQSPGVVFLTGFRSDMTGQKALRLETWARATGAAYLRFDYRGHGRSWGRFTDGTIGDWLEDVLAVLDRLTEGPQVLVGSSLGGWLAVLAALARPERVAALAGIASAPDFTESLIWPSLDPEQRRRLLAEGEILLPCAYDEPTPVTLRLIEEARRHLVLGGPVALDCPVRLVHGMQDEDVPWQTSLRLVERIRGADVRLVLVKDGGHRLSRPEDLDLIVATVAALRAAVAVP